MISDNERTNVSMDFPYSSDCDVIHVTTEAQALCQSKFCKMFDREFP